MLLLLIRGEIFGQLQVNLVYETNDHSAHGIRASGNEELFVMARNNRKHFFIQHSPYENGKGCTLPYANESLYVYSLSVLPKSHNQQWGYSYGFLYLYENMKNQTDYVSMYMFNSTKDCQSKFEKIR